MQSDSMAWQTFGSMTLPEHHQDLNMPPHPSRPIKESRSQDEEWQKICDELVAGSEQLAHYNTYSPPGAAAGAMQTSPIQSIEIPTGTLQEHGAMLSTGNSQGLPFSYMGSMQQFEPTWPTAVASSYPPAIPENEQWVSTPGQFAQDFPQTRYPAATGHFANPAVCQPTLDHHLVAGTSPMISEGSPFHQDIMDEGWATMDSQQPSYDGTGSEELLDDPENADPCYAQLLYRCLKEAPDHTLSLRELYDWVREHSQKAKDPKNRGWQNSVRHNLSMNAAFERVPPGQSQGVKKGSLWRLTPSALNNGVISTTRYRKDPKRKPERRSSPALKRQLSGAKGGQATRNATRRQQALREARTFTHMSARQRHFRNHRHHGPDHFNPVPFRSHPGTPQPYMELSHTAASPYFIDVDEAVPQMPMSAPQTPPQMQMMYDTQPKSALSDFNFSHIDFTNGGLIGDHDVFTPDTPSLATEASYMSEEGIQSLTSCNASREATSFPVDC